MLKTKYINTDLDLKAAFDLKPLTDALEALGVLPLHNPQLYEGDWSVTLETEQNYEDPEANITAMLDAIDALEGQPLVLWNECNNRVFDIGYKCGGIPYCLRNELSNGALLRIAQAGAELRVTIYGTGDQWKGEG